jgi:FlaA1/EpsC-like NDP-sugar epimerase
MPQRLFQNLSRSGLLWISPRALIWAAQVAIFLVSGVVAFLLRFEFQLQSFTLKQLQYALPLWVLAKSFVFGCSALDRGWWRHYSVPDAVRCGIANLVGSAIGAVLILVIAPAGFPRSIYFLDLLVCMHATLGARLFARIVCDVAVHSPRDPQAPQALIYGAGGAGVTLLSGLRSTSSLHYDVCGFIDDNRRKVGMRVQGVPVLGHGDDLAEIVSKLAITEILIAIPSADGPQMARILERCHQAGVRCKTVPGLDEILRGTASAVQIRDVAVEDLLDRSTVELEIDQICDKIEGQVVLITGAAGSIGSELCRQVARFKPAAIVAFDAGETPLFYLQEEMRERFPGVVFHAEIGTIQNRCRLTALFAAYGPSIVYHAAAYKHVPLMEAHIFEAVENNILGTYCLATTAADYGVETFVMISSDKAVRPTNVMGATKRIAELLIRSLQSRGTQFVSVRFGNVLGSQGSVVPLFKKQIAAGGPVTVTDPNMCRYFMTIPEACQLVLQASTMGKGGEIFVLDMGQPVKIVDLARNLILLSGLRPDIDVKIEFTGTRPGEKLYEELSTLEEQPLPTFHQKIKVFAGSGIQERMLARVNTLRELCDARDRRRLVMELKDIVPEYTPSCSVLPDVVEARLKQKSAAA